MYTWILSSKYDMYCNEEISRPLVRLAGAPWQNSLDWLRDDDGSVVIQGNDDTIFIVNNPKLRGRSPTHLHCHKRALN